MKYDLRSRARGTMSLLALITSMQLPVAAQSLGAPAPAPVFTTTATTPQTIDSVFVDRVLVKATVNGKSLWFQLDSGFAGLVLGDDAVRLLGLTAANGSELNADLNLGPLHAASARFIVARLGVDDHGYHVSGIIGAPLFLANIVTIDYTHKQVVVYPGDSYDALRVAQNANPVELHGGIARIHAWFGGTRATMLLDTGAAQTILFQPFAQGATVGPPLGQPKPVTIGIDATWTTVVEYATKPMLVGGVEIGSPTVLVAGRAPADLPISLYDGVLGRDVYRIFSTMTFDYPNSEVYLAPPQ